METRTLTVQRALTRRKIIAKQLEELQGSALVHVAKLANKDSQAAKEAFLKSQSLFDEFNTLVAEHDKLSDAINRSNLETVVHFRGEAYTVARLISMKETFRFRKQRLQNIRAQYADGQRMVERANEDVNRQISEDSLKLFGRDESGNPVQPTEEANTLIIRNAEKNHAKVMIVGFDVAKFIEDEKDFVNEFEQEVDILLSESNAVTIITI